MRKAEIKMHDITAGWLTEDEHGYHFSYDQNYLKGYILEIIRSDQKGSDPVTIRHASS